MPPPTVIGHGFNIFTINLTGRIQIISFFTKAVVNVIFCTLVLHVPGDSFLFSA
jgi:hypothetical protein